MSDEMKRAAQAALAEVRLLINQALEQAWERVDGLSAIVRKLEVRIDGDDWRRATETRLENLEVDLTKLEAKVIDHARWLNSPPPHEVPLPYDVVEASERHATDKRAAAMGRYAKLAAKGPPPGVPAEHVGDPIAFSVAKMKREIDEARNAAKVAERDAIMHREARSVAEGTVAQWEQMCRELLLSVDDSTIGRLRDSLAAAIQSNNVLKEQRDEANRQMNDQRTELRENVRKLEEQLERQRNDLDAQCADIAEVWAAVESPDEFGSPFWSEPGLDDTTPAQAVARVLEHLRNKIKATDKGRESARKGCDTLGSQLTIAQRDNRELRKLNETQAEERRRIEEAHWRGVKLWKEANPAIAAGSLPPQREDVVAWALTRITDLEREHASHVANLQHAHAHDIEEMQAHIAKVAAENAAAVERMRAAERSCKEHYSKVVTIEQQLERRNKLDAMRLHTHDALTMRIVDVANEKYGPFPVMSAEDALSALEQGAWWDARHVEILRRLTDAVERWSHSDGEGPIAEAGASVGLLDVKMRTQTELQEYCAQREAAFRRFYGPEPEVDDCQAGTCDCPKLPGIEHASGAALDEMAALAGVQRDPAKQPS